MRNKWFLITGLSLLVVGLLAACGGTITAPTATGSGQVVASLGQTNSDGGTAFAAQTVEGGSVTVKVTPRQALMNAPLEFEIVMDTHSVELADDMLKVAVLRDDAGKEYAPLKWDGPGAGGHHREGILRFAPMKDSMKQLTLVIKNVAGVPERLYSWELAR